MRQYDYIIVGGGLAGSLMAITLWGRGKKILRFDAALSACSRVAAGMINPVNFRTYSLTWKAALLQPFAEKFYFDLEKNSGKKFFHPRQLIHPFTTTTAPLWKAAQEKHGTFFFGNQFDSIPHEGLNAPFGAAPVNGAGQLDTNALIAFAASVCDNEGKFDPGKLVLRGDGVEYENYSATRIIFCEGHLSDAESFFGFVPILPLKGQLLQLEIDSLPRHLILNGAGYLLPSFGGGWALGATHERGLRDETSDEKGREELEKKLGQLITLPWRITGRHAGVRPTTRDHRPVLGTHPQNPQMAIFNGLGSKGSLQGPWLAAQLAENLENGQPLPAEIDVKRFWPKK